MLKRQEFPDTGDFVICTVKDVKDFGAFGDLDEYPDKEGFIHISEVASGWVKYVRDYVREGQKVVTKVLKVDEGRGHVDLSLKRINEHQRREKIAEWKNDQKAHKLMEMLAEDLGHEVKELYEEFGFDLQEEYGSLYAAFEAAAIDAEVLREDGFEGDWFDAFVELAQENISIPFVTIHGYLDVTNPAPDGVKRVQEALSRAEKSEFEDVDIEVQYVGAPRYRIVVTAPDYKIAEDQLEKAAKRSIQAITENGGQGDYSREQENE